MPAAPTKQESKTSPEAMDPMKQVLIVMDKKVRNLEKRKGKLDGYKEKKDSGTTLEKDQQLAIEKYGEVIQNLEFARELQKHFTSLAQEADRYVKKQAKKEKADRQGMEVKRIGDILRYQNLLDAMGSEKVRSDFQTGKHGAVVLTEENLKQLDDLYKLLSPSREGESNYAEELTKASEHFASLLDGKDKPVVGTTYKDLKVLIDLIDDCGYFEHAMQEEEGHESEFVVVSTTEIPEADSAEVQASLPPEQTEQSTEQSSTATPSNNEAQMESMREADSFFSQKSAAPPQANPPLQQQQQRNVPYTRQRPFQEIVSEVQGSCIFLQESTIDMESPHMDPAVVAVTSHPMGHPTSTPQSDPTQISSQTYTNQGFPVASQQKLSQQAVDYSQTFSQSLQSDSLFQSTDNGSSQMSQNVLNQNVSDSTISQFEMPPQIPMPPGQEERARDVQAEKFQMNPNAEMFQSKMHSSYSVSDDGQNADGFSQGPHDDHQGDYGNGYSSGYRSRGGGYRGGRGNRGGDRGGMSNGFGGRGRGSYGGNRGGYQGYNNRDNYRGDNYNSYNNGYQKRGGGGQPRGGSRGAGRGGPRGGGFNNKSAGGVRGGNSGGFGKPQPHQQAA